MRAAINKALGIHLLSIKGELSEGDRIFLTYILESPSFKGDIDLESKLPQLLKNEHLKEAIIKFITDNEDGDLFAEFKTVLGF